ncbi:hypothetical protein [Streptomyces sp. Isolate_45]|nr:hypothetical protein [Streptomyces sp. Isolate_45]MDA5283680.1 hypothetical protein [Streptomyces sp. Isolate_45]
MSRATAPRCHGRRMKADKAGREFRCPRCGAWTVRLLALGGAR